MVIGPTCIKAGTAKAFIYLRRPRSGRLRAPDAHLPLVKALGLIGLELSFRLHFSYLRTPKSTLNKYGWQLSSTIYLDFSNTKEASTDTIRQTPSHSTLSTLSSQSPCEDTVELGTSLVSQCTSICVMHVANKIFKYAVPVAAVIH